MVAPSNEPMSKSNHGFLELWCDGRPPPPPVATTTTLRPNATAEVENGDDGDGSTESTMERERPEWHERGELYGCGYTREVV